MGRCDDDPPLYARRVMPIAQARVCGLCGRAPAPLVRHLAKIGDVVMARQDYDLELRRYDGRGWRAVFFPSGFEHSLTSHAGSAWARSPWEAVQRAAQDALHKLETGELVPRDWTVADESPA